MNLFNTDEYRLTTAMNMIKIVACEINNYYSKIYTPSDTQALPRVTITCSDPLITPPPPPYSHPSPSQTSLSVNQHNSKNHSQTSSTTKLRKTCPIVPEEGLLLAIKACEGFQGCREHNDIDESQTMLVWVYMYKHTLVHVHAHVHTLIHVQRYIHTCTHICRCTYMYTHMYMYICMYTHTVTHQSTSTHTYYIYSMCMFSVL